MRQTMILGAALAALLISAIPADAGCLSGLFGGRRSAANAYSSFSSSACATGSCAMPQLAVQPVNFTSVQPANFTSIPCSTCPSGSAYVPTASYYTSPRYVQSAPIVSTQAIATGCGCCDRCRCTVNLPQAPSIPPTLGNRDTKPPDPIAPPIAYTPPARSEDVLVAFR